MPATVCPRSAHHQGLYEGFVWAHVASFWSIAWLAGWPAMLLEMYAVLPLRRSGPGLQRTGCREGGQGEEGGLSCLLLRYGTAASSGARLRPVKHLGLAQRPWQN